MNHSRCGAPVRNYYGGPFVYKEAGKFFLAIDDYTGESTCEVSKAFYYAFHEEFGASKTVEPTPCA